MRREIHSREQFVTTRLAITLLQIGPETTVRIAGKGRGQYWVRAHVHDASEAAQRPLAIPATGGPVCLLANAATK